MLLVRHFRPFQGVAKATPYLFEHTNRLADRTYTLGYKCLQVLS
jgi:hypothetical protein